MEESRIKDLSNYRLLKAKKNIKVVPGLIKDGYYDFAANRAYYAAFNAMRAVNALDDFDSSKHSGVIAHFNQYYVKTGKFKPETSAVIRRVSNLREKSDYEDFYEATKKDAEDAYLLINDFIYEVETFLSSLDKPNKE